MGQVQMVVCDHLTIWRGEKKLTLVNRRDQRVRVVRFPRDCLARRVRAGFYDCSGTLVGELRHPWVKGFEWVPR